jgi:hypothetical protein
VNLADLCDIAYVMLLDDLKQLVLSDRLVAATYIANGAEGISLPDPTETKTRLDEFLSSDQLQLSEDQQLCRALGLIR